MAAIAIEFHCADADCQYEGLEENDFFKCEACQRHLCPNHAFEPLNVVGRVRFRFCQDCYKCSCGAEAWIMCEQCGELKCPAHAAARDDEYVGLTCLDQPAEHEHAPSRKEEIVDADCPF
jgi:hypothetical protein